MDTGSSDLIPADEGDVDDDGNSDEKLPLDLDRRPRIIRSVDMGAYEYSRVVYVDQTAPGPVHDGSTWDYALLEVRDALPVAAQAGESVQIWVAAATYTPAPGTQPYDRDATFSLSSGVEIYGGFKPASESPLPQERDELGDRQPRYNRTVLSGDLAGNDLANFIQNRTDNSHYVVTADGVTGVIIDGFVIGHGGRGLWIDDESQVKASRCVLEWNSASGVHTFDSEVVLDSCALWHNQADFGAGLRMDRGVVDVVNCTITQNESTGGLGGGIFGHSLAESALLIDSSVVWGNTGYQAPSIEQAQLDFVGPGSLAVNYSCFEDSDPDDATVRTGTQNIDDDPLFRLFWGGADWHLQLDTSPAIDAGNLNPLTDVKEDWDSDARIMSGQVDMGADEFGGCLDDSECYDKVWCTVDSCESSSCMFAWTRTFGDVNLSVGSPTVDDLLCMLNTLEFSVSAACLPGASTLAEQLPNCDLVGSTTQTCMQNGSVDINDLLALLDTLGGVPPCSCDEELASGSELHSAVRLAAISTRRLAVVDMVGRLMSDFPEGHAPNAKARLAEGFLVWVTTRLNAEERASAALMLQSFGASAADSDASTIFPALIDALEAEVASPEA